MVNYKLAASSTTEDGLKQIIIKALYWSTVNFTWDAKGSIAKVSNLKGISPYYYVEKKGKRFRLMAQEV